MPTYGYKCTQCNHEFEVFQRITDEPIKECEKCGSGVKKVVYPVGIVFKGSGFHINDYRKTEKPGGNGHEDAKPAAPAPAEKAVEKVEAPKSSEPK